MNKKVKNIVVIGLVLTIAICIATIIGGIKQDATPITNKKKVIPISFYEKNFSIKLPEVKEHLYSIEETKDYRFLFYHKSKLQSCYSVYSVDQISTSTLKKGSIIGEMYPSADVPTNFNVKDLSDNANGYYLKKDNQDYNLYVQIVANKLYIWEERKHEI